MIPIFAPISRTSPFPSFKRERNLDDKSNENGKETNELSKNVDVSEKNLEDNSNLDPKTESVAEAN